MPYHMTDSFPTEWFPGLIGPMQASKLPGSCLRARAHGYIATSTRHETSDLARLGWPGRYVGSPSALDARHKETKISAHGGLGLCRNLAFIATLSEI